MKKRGCQLEAFKSDPKNQPMDVWKPDRKVHSGISNSPSLSTLAVVNCRSLKSLSLECSSDITGILLGMINEYGSTEVSFSVRRRD